MRLRLHDITGNRFPTKVLKGTQLEIDECGVPGKTSTAVCFDSDGGVSLCNESQDTYRVFGDSPLLLKP